MPDVTLPQARLIVGPMFAWLVPASRRKRRAADPHVRRQNDRHAHRTCRGLGSDMTKAFILEPGAEADQKEKECALSERAELEAKRRKRRTERVRLARQYLQDHADAKAAANGQAPMDRTSWLMTKMVCNRAEAEYLVATVDHKRAPSAQNQRRQ